MRALFVCLIAFFMVGCSVQRTSTIDESKFSDMRLKKATNKNKAQKYQPSSVRLYTKTEELLGKPFKDLGIVAGQSCRDTIQEAPASIAVARRQMLNRAAALKADAVLLHQCDVTVGQGCYQIAICEGSALKVNNG